MHHVVALPYTKLFLANPTTIVVSPLIDFIFTLYNEGYKCESRLNIV